MIRAALLALTLATPAAATDRQIIGTEGDWFVSIARATDGTYFCEAGTATSTATMRVRVDSTGWYGFDIYFEDAVISESVSNFTVFVGAAEWTLRRARAYNNHIAGSTMMSFDFGPHPAQFQFVRDLARANRAVVYDRFQRPFEVFSLRGSARAIAGMDGCRCVIMEEC